MVQEMANGDGLSVGGELGEDLGERLVVAEFTVMDEEHDGHGCELLGDGREAEIGVLINLVERAEIGYAIAALKDRAAIFDDNDSRTGRGRRDVREQGIHLGRFWIGCPNRVGDDYHAHNQHAGSIHSGIPLAALGLDSGDPHQSSCDALFSSVRK